MNQKRELDCVVIGYNDVPLENYDRLLRGYGEDSEAYRDLRLSVSQLAGEKRLYAELMNHSVDLAANGQGNGRGVRSPVFKSGDIPNLAAAYLTNFLRRRSHRVRYINLFQDEKERLARMLEEKPLCVAITTTFYVINFPVNGMVQFIREHSPETKVVVGGPLIANHERNYSGKELETSLADTGADIFVVESQGELTLSRLLDCFKAGGDLRQVPNLLYFENGRLERSQLEPEFNSLDENFIDWYDLADGEDLGATLQTRTARSCAFSCAFCNYPKRAGKLTLAGLDTLERELDSMKKLGNVRNVVFIDDTFNVPLPRFKDICRLMIEKDYGFNWFSYFRCSNSDEEAVELMARSGCKGVFLGIESGSPQILKNMAKAATIEKYERGIKLLKQHGVLTFGSFITGFPGETDATVRETNDFIESSGMDYFRTQLWYCEAGTPIELKRDQYGIEGEGFVWSHDTMESLEAMDWVERSFLSIDSATWLPQWSFDFWIIPYLMGKGVELESFRRFMRLAQKTTALGVASVPDTERLQLEADLIGGLTAVGREWQDIQ